MLKNLVKYCNGENRKIATYCKKLKELLKLNFVFVLIIMH